ncbi:MAG TPA: tRNA (5-methylaminomethyl-2-thiouridine)(34)-methyltransferase MnmD [Saprospiraceae bacterium]|nr:tRNA (5-methylaminomethyl-2-thiouridine)(34)-methyltransferase MnmD [Saprospiraceae bacterium]HPN68910.1 tRNA (5-methylaminomethyl-2-thiouridine)(34)-methyltransferase MnmD [Saprospiraceae bacterium]
MAKIILSDDGSHTLFSEQFQVTYHSHHGSLQESNTIFINAGLRYLMEKGYESIHIFEMGFGSGLNALLSYLFGKEVVIEINYTGIEAYPIDLETAQKLNYAEILGLDTKAKKVFDEMHRLAFFTEDSFQFNKIIDRIEDTNIQTKFDVVFYDAFSPEIQTNLWEAELMSKMYDALNPGGILVTYCAKGAFKRALKSCGFIVEALPGPKGKREITRAIKPLL